MLYCLLPVAGEWAPATITHISKSGKTCSVQFDDDDEGDISEGIKATRLKPLEDESSSSSSSEDEAEAVAEAVAQVEISAEVRAISNTLTSDFFLR